jgi:hypothetical protein
LKVAHLIVGGNAQHTHGHTVVAKKFRSVLHAFKW